MDQRERINDPHEAFKLILDGRQIKTWTAIPGIILQYYPDTQTADVQPTIQGINTDASGTSKFVNLPKLVDCPVQFPSGGAGGTTGQQTVGGSASPTSTTSIGSMGGNQPYGVTLTFPVQVGDECLVVFTSRGFDNWWQSGGIQPPQEARMHDLSDGFVLLGFRSQPRKLKNVSTTTCQLRSDDGITVLNLDANNQTIAFQDNTGKNHISLDIKNQNINATAQNNIVLQDPTGQTLVKIDTKNGVITLQASSIKIIGPITQSNGGITGSTDVSTSTGVTLNTHVHPGVTTGTGTTQKGEG